MREPRLPALPAGKVVVAARLELEADGRAFGYQLLASAIEQRAERPWPHGDRFVRARFEALDADHLPGSTRR